MSAVISKPAAPPAARVLSVTVGVVAAAAIAYTVAALLEGVPLLVPDEFLYQRLARSLAAGHGMTWRGQHEPLRAALYVYLIAPVWLIASGWKAYQLAKVESTAMLLTLALPVWWLARDVLSPRLVPLAVALVLSGTWMLCGTSLMTEDLALPLAAGATSAAVVGLRRADARPMWLAIVLALLAAWARLQLVVLIPVLLGAVLAEAARAGRDWRTPLRVHRAPLAGLVAIVAVGVVLTEVAGPSVTGGYNAILHYSVGAGPSARAAGRELLQLVAMVGILPALLGAALVVRPRAWRDPVVGPLLAVALPLVVALAVQNGFYIGGTAGLWSIQRYMEYGVPVLLILMLAALERPGLVDRRAVAMTAALVLPLWLARPVQEPFEQRGTLALTDLLGGATPRVALMVFALALCGVVAASRRWQVVRPVAFSATVGVAVLLLLVGQTTAAWRWQYGVTSAFQGMFGHDVRWLDEHRHGSVSVLEFNSVTPFFGVVDFFNDGIDRFYATSPVVPGYIGGGACFWNLRSDGTLQFSPGCGPRGDEFLIADPNARLRFYNQVRSVSQDASGELIQVRGRPRLMALLGMACPVVLESMEPVTLRVIPASAPHPCGNKIVARFWLSRPATVEVTIQGAPLVPHVVTIDGQRQQVIPAGRSTVVRVPVPAGFSDNAIGTDWSEHGPLDPDVTDVELLQGSHRTSLLR